MTNHPMLKPTKAKKAKKAGSGTKKSSSGTKKPSSSEPVQEQAGKGSQHAAGSPVAVHSYTALLSCNGNFDLPFEWQYPATAADNWSTEAQLDE